MDRTKLWDTAKNTYKIQQIREEWEWLIETSKLLPNSNILEIGSFEGGTSYYLSNFANNMISIDNHEPCLFDYSSFLKHCNYKYVGADSHHVDQVKLFSSYDWDFVFIDGDHSYEGVKADFYNILPNLKRGCAVAFHDIVVSQFHHNHGCYVGEFWNELKENLPFSDSITHELSTTDSWAGIGLIIL
jgi:predicted O-methyltransferase YrrM